MERIETRFAPSKVSPDGTFSGYGAVFGNVDSHGDVIRRGAFEATLRVHRLRGRLPKMLLEHGSAGNPFRFDDLPVGRWHEMREDAIGLWCEGQILAQNTDQGRRIYSLMAGGVLDGLSIGFNTVRSTPGSGTVKRWVEEIRLKEVSLVGDPSNDDARVMAMKAPPAHVAADEAFVRLQATLKGLPPPPAAPTAFERLRVALQGLA